MEKESCRSAPGIILFFCLAVILCFLSYSTLAVSLIQGFNVYAGDRIEPDTLLKNKVLNKMGMDIYAEKNGTLRNIKERPVATEPGKMYLHFRFLGVPFKKLAVNAVSQVNVIPGGQSIGIVMHSKGIMVVGMSNIVDESGRTVNPAEEAGIKIGDLLLSANGTKLESEFHLRNEIYLLGKSDKPVELEIKRGSKTFKTSIKPVPCSETGRPRVGLFVRDTASGVGTMSFYHPESSTYGALGHIITDIDTAISIDPSDGKITEANIRGIHRGKKGQPGEKIGMFIESGSISGNIDKNSRYGIFGKLQKPIENPFYGKPVPVALSYQIKKGPAEMLTVVDGTEIRKFQVEIQEILYPWNNQNRGLIIRINDPGLENVTGGIIQGMSGSPIMQDGLLVGVLTHVLINDPMRGYGVPAEWMIREAGLLNFDNKLQKVS